MCRADSHTQPSVHTQIACKHNGCSRPAQHLTLLWQVANQREGATLSMSTSTAGLLAHMHGSMASQPSNAESASDAIQAFHGASATSSTNRSLEMQHMQQPASPRSVAATPSNESAGQITMADVRHSPRDLSCSPAQRPLFTALIETG